MRDFDILFAKVSAERVWTWSKDDEIVEIFKQWDWYGGTLRVRDDQDFDLDKIRKNIMRFRLTTLTKKFWSQKMISMRASKHYVQN